MANGFQIRYQTLGKTEEGYARWVETVEPYELAPEKTAFVITDMWDAHWCYAASRRCAALAPLVDAAAERLRGMGVLIVHAPCDTMPFYKDHPARLRMLPYLDAQDGAPVREVPEYPLPIDDSDGGSDSVGLDPMTEAEGNTTGAWPWKRQQAAIRIDADRDVIVGDSDGHHEGPALRAYLKERGIGTTIHAGVHTNMCVLNRSFAIKAMLRHGFQPLLARDLTDAMYNPARPPYVQHAEGTALVVAYIEQHYCPSLLTEGRSFLS